MKTKIKVLGERNTGTTYTQRIIRNNLKVGILRGVVPAWFLLLTGATEPARDFYFRLTGKRNLGWKHAVAPSRLDTDSTVFDQTIFVVLVKNPYSWLLSLYRRPYHGRSCRSFHEFLQSPWTTVGRERSVRRYPSPMALWNVKVQSYLQLLREGTCESWRYEDLLENPEKLIVRLSEQFGLQRRQPTFVGVQASTKNDPGKSFSSYRSYYLQEQWRQKYDRWSVDIVNQGIDVDLMKYWRYPLLAPEQLLANAG